MLQHLKVFPTIKSKDTRNAQMHIYDHWKDKMSKLVEQTFLLVDKLRNRISFLSSRLSSLRSMDEIYFIAQVVRSIKNVQSNPVCLLTNYSCLHRREKMIKTSFFPTLQ